MYHFKAKDSEIKKSSLCLEDISVDFSANTIKKVGLNRCVHDIFVDYRAFDTSNVINIHKYLMKANIWVNFKKIIRLLTGLVNGSNHTKYVFLTNQKCTVQRTVIVLHSNKYTQGLHYYTFSVNLDICVGSCNILNDLSNKVCVPNKTEDSNLSVFNIITEKNESKTLTKHISCECKGKFDDKKWNSNQKWNNDKCRSGCKKHICEKVYIWNPATCSCKLLTIHWLHVTKL